VRAGRGAAAVEADAEGSPGARPANGHVARAVDGEGLTVLERLAVLLTELYGQQTPVIAGLYVSQLAPDLSAIASAMSGSSFWSRCRRYSAKRLRASIAIKLGRGSFRVRTTVAGQ
jgi:hypothetical protein